ncbi:FAD-dependent monooxygenase [Pseudonocardia thermophila]|uniref:FAD-dependent monooxygenase n=1 Tax=Pseudonocardia thermophila TaxID=1848 RepID=UPI00248E5E84|nr:FAD-dependent monooxygenase [Pseudonocardia thermophila]
MTAEIETDTEVVIVGGGPVGVGLALELGLRGIRCVVLEQRTELSMIPKGQGLSQRTMEHMWRWGVADEIRAARTMPPGYAIGQVTAYESLMGEFWAAPPTREVVAPYYFQANERLPQYRTEEVLRRRLAAVPGVQLRLGVRAVAVEQDADRVHVVAEGEAGREAVTAAYVVGCDGGRSIVREQADIPRSGTDWDELVALVVFRSPELHRALGRFPDRSTYRVLHPDLRGYWMFFGRVDVGEQFFFHAPVPREARTGRCDFAGLLHRASGFPFACTIEHVGFWDLRVQVAHTYRIGRVFIAGDAAHTHPPYGGFGLNNGLEDAVNLGWKLAAVLQGWGGEGLLETYSLERQPVFRDVGEDIIGGWIRDDREFLAAFDPRTDRAAFERRFAEVAAGFGRRLREFEPHYEGSPIVFGPPDGVVSAHGEHTFRARPGHHLPPLPLSDGRNVFEALGPRFTLLALDTEPFEAPGLTVVRDTYADGREAYGSRLILVRPDQFVAWTGQNAPADPDAVLQTVNGWRLREPAGRTGSRSPAPARP